MRHFIVLLVALCGCTKSNPAVCCVDADDCASVGISGSEVRCNDGLVCRGHNCISLPCESSQECEAAAPYCAGGVCGETCSSDSECPGFNQNVELAFCVDGQCGECRTSDDCSPQAPICANASCSGCTADSQCSSGVCDQDSGACIDEAAILYTAPPEVMTPCLRTSPCGVRHALTLVTPTRNVIKLSPGMNLQTIFQAPTVDVTLFGPGEIPPMYIAAGSVVRIRDATIRGYVLCGNNLADGETSRLELDRCNFVENIMLEVQPACDAVLRRSTIRVPDPGAGNSAVLITGYGAGGFTHASSLLIDRSRITYGGSGRGVSVGAVGKLLMLNSIVDQVAPTTAPAVLVSDMAIPSTISFSTIIGPMQCPTGVIRLEAANNIITNTGATDSVTGTACHHVYSVIFPQSSVPSGGANLIFTDPLFVDKNGGNLHLTGVSPAVDAADPNATEETDFDARPRPVGAQHDIGAFEYSP